MKLKATFTYFISLVGCNFTESYRVFSSCNQNTDTLVPVFLHLSEALLETQFLYNVHICRFIEPINNNLFKR